MVVVKRRRRTRRHRRNRLLRRILSVFVLSCFTLASAFVTLRYLSPSLFHARVSPAQERQATETSRNDFQRVQEEALRQWENRPVYPYSVVPGGVRTPRELKWAADHDPVVRAHYAGFDYAHARLVRLALARSVYVSYRIGNQVFWTRHRVTLKKGETIITDGNMIARTRCANRVEEVPQQATSTSEPPASKFDEPVPPATGTAKSAPPVPFLSALNERPSMPGLGPAPPLGLYDPLGWGSVVPLSPPPLPGVCGVGKKKDGSSGTGTGKKGKGEPCGPGGGGTEVPEPGTWLLLGTGLAFACWMNRHRFARN